MQQPRPKFQGDWTCSMCGGKITELPFQPNPDRTNTLKCLACFKKEREAQGR
jgi:CxxC-x17-CxxC domain-containing protein